MKAKKVISMLLVAVMLFTVMNVSVFADSTVYTRTEKYTISSAYKFDADDFKVSLSIDESKIAATEGGTTAYTKTINSIVIDGVDYLTDPDEFVKLFDTVEGEEAKAKDMYIDFTIDFESDSAFGALDYTITVEGFTQSAISGGIGSGSIDDIIGSIPAAADIKITGSFKDFPTVDESTIKVESKPSKTDYYDSERFDLTGTTVEFELTNGKNGKIVYSDDTARYFKTSPTSKENLTVNDNEVAIFFMDIVIAYIPVSVEHKWSDGPVNITTYKYTESNPGYHAIVCEGCGATHSAEQHVVNEDEWVYNNDQSFVSNGTASNVCEICNTVLTKDVMASADYNKDFANLHFLLVIFDYINALLRIIDAAIGK